MARRFQLKRCKSLVLQKVPSLWLRKLASIRFKPSKSEILSRKRALRTSLQQRALDKQSKQLRILFCGSDEFSSVSLRAIEDLRQRKPSLVKSIDVMIRPGKPSGRSMKNIREVPIKAVAQELGLRIHERDTFTGWEPPLIEGRPINLIVAVSFGLFVPPRILKAATYGGLNVHPSLLPNLHGPAPIHHTILTGQKYTGVTVQTLHEKTFDHGLILSQTRRLVEVKNEMKYADLHEKLTPIGAKLLVDSIERCLHVPPLRDVGGHKVPEGELRHAPKITAADRKIDFKQRFRIIRQHRALGRLWADIFVDETTTKRCVFEDFEEVDYFFEQDPDADKKPLLTKGSNIILDGTSESPPPGFRVLVSPTSEGGKAPMFYVETGDAILIAARGRGKWRGHRKRETLRVTKITIAGESTKPAAAALRSLQKNGRWVIGGRDNQITEIAEQPKVSLWKSEVKGFSIVPTDARKYLQYPFVPKEREEKAEQVLPRREEASGEAAPSKSIEETVAGPTQEEGFDDNLPAAPFAPLAKCQSESTGGAEKFQMKDEKKVRPAGDSSSESL